MAKSASVVKGKKVQFTISAEPGSHVFVAGSFNNWSPETHALKHGADGGVFRTALHLPNGTHEYKFIVNGVWMVDPTCRSSVGTPGGDLNSVLHV